MDYFNLQTIKTKTVSEIKSIFQKVADVQRKIVPIAKERNNQSQGFKFRGVEDVYNMVHPLLSEAGIFTTSRIVKDIREDKQTKSGGTVTYTILDIEFTFFAEDGSFITSQARGEGMDSGDKGSNKAMAIAHKYALVQLFTIPYQDMPDTDKDAATTLDDLKELFEYKREALTSEEETRAKRIIDNKESASYTKLLTYLKTK